MSIIYFFSEQLLDEEYLNLYFSLSYSMFFVIKILSCEYYFEKDE